MPGEATVDLTHILLTHDSYDSFSVGTAVESDQLSEQLDPNPIGSNWNESDSDDDVFIGSWESDEMHGPGVYVWSKLNPEHGYFRGRIEHGQKHGFGTEVWKNGQVYDGYFEDGLKNGFGNFKFPTSSVFDRYVGDFKDDELHGEGFLTWKNGNVYRGEFLNGEMHGRGEMIWKSHEEDIEEVRFEGPWSGGFIRGQGNLQFIGKDSTQTFEGLFEEVKGKQNFWLKFQPENAQLSALIEQIF